MKAFLFQPDNTVTYIAIERHDESTFDDLCKYLKGTRFYSFDFDKGTVLVINVDAQDKKEGLNYFATNIMHQIDINCTMYGVVLAFSYLQLSSEIKFEVYNDNSKKTTT